MSRITPASSPRISVVAPIYNEVESLRQLVDETISALDSLGGSYEILLVDDGSEDGSGELIEELARWHESVRPLRRQRRGGQSAAILAGIRAARGEIVVTIDADLQNDPADIPLLVGRLGDYDLVGGLRARRHDTRRRRVASRIANAIRRAVLGDSFRDIGCSLKAYRASYLRDLPTFDGLHRFLPALVEHRGARVTEVPVRHRSRPFGVSKYGIGGRALRGLQDLIGVRWLERRALDPSLIQEIHIGRPRTRSPTALDPEVRDPGHPAIERPSDSAAPA
jgi:dolichol-phosphate mannosyltransferase